MSLSCSAELAAVLGYYRARIEAARRGASPRDIAAAVRALLNEQIMAVRAVVERAGAARQAKAAKAPLPNIGGRQPS